NIGGAGRLEFSVIGDAVNIAARVESATRQTGDLVLLTGQTLALLGRDHGEFVARPGLSLKGKTAPVEIYAPAVASGRGVVSPSGISAQKVPNWRAHRGTLTR